MFATDISNGQILKNLFRFFKNATQRGEKTKGNKQFTKEKMQIAERTKGLLNNLKITNQIHRYHFCISNC